jgi:hypothetical protein
VLQGGGDNPAMPLADLTSFADLAPYLAIVGAGFLLGAWGSSARVPLAVALGIALIALGLFLFQQRQDDFGGLPPPCEQPPCR